MKKNSMVLGLVLGAVFGVMLSSCTRAPQEVVHEPLPVVEAPKGCAVKEWCYSDFLKPMITDTMIGAEMTPICAGYKSLTTDQKRLAWVNLIKAISKAESNWNTNSVYEESFIDHATGKKALSVGMLQLSIGDKANYKTPYCQKLTVDSLKNAEINLGCGAEIMNVLISRNRDIYNLGRYWSVMRKDNARHKVVLQNFQCK